MKLEPKAKPIRIRVMSGGEEHATLDSLLQNFKVEDVLPLIQDKRLVRWLQQQNESELASRVEVDIVNDFDSKNEKTYRKTLMLFFPGYLKTTDDLLNVYKSINQKYPKTAMHLIESIINNEWSGYVNEQNVVRVYNEFKDLAINWVAVFEKYGHNLKGEAQYEFGLKIKNNCDGNAELTNYGLLLMRRAKGSDEFIPEEIDDFLRRPSEYGVSKYIPDTDNSYSKLVCFLIALSNLYRRCMENVSSEEVVTYTESILTNIPRCYNKQAVYLKAIAKHCNFKYDDAIKLLNGISDYYPARIMKYYYRSVGGVVMDEEIRSIKDFCSHILYIVRRLKLNNHE